MKRCFTAVEAFEAALMYDDEVFTNWTNLLSAIHMKILYVILCLHFVQTLNVKNVKFPAFLNVLLLIQKNRAGTE